MDIDSLKEALEDEKFSALKTYVQGLEIRDADGRAKFKKLADDRDALRKKFEKLADHYGIDQDSDLSELPPAKPDVEAAKQFEAKLRRAERERDDAKKAADEWASKLRGSQQRAAIADAIGAHDFDVDARDIVESYISQRLVWEGDDLMFKADDGKLVGVKDGVAGIAKTRPKLLKPTGTGGAGVRQSNAVGNGGVKQMTRAEFEAMPPAQRLEASKAGVQLT